MLVTKDYIPLDWDRLKFWDFYFKKNGLKQTIEDRARLSGKEVYPPRENWFQAFEYTSFEDTRVVILGQDPYHNGDAHGLAFSTLPHTGKLPPSLRNILNEYSSDLGFPFPRSGDLRQWAISGVLLLNTALTVEKGKANSHRGIGWERLTYEVIRELDTKAEQEVIFLLWGKDAQEYRGAIENSEVLWCDHPSPLASIRSRYSDRPFRGCRHFSKVNEYFASLGLPPVTWRL